ncbi:MAG TPA: hypothetical protein VM717_10460 [Chthoniobacterales bacterium]|jgi:hypothetical protein|nr:hypothetical protein [Chthoniobacterales bacterium]
MKTVRFALALFLFGSSALLFANDFNSEVIMPNSPGVNKNVPDGQFMVIRNFTQIGGNQRGAVNVIPLGQTGMTTVLTAAILDPTSPPEVINEVVIAGPATVIFTCGSDATGNCFITFRKISQ